MCDKRALSNIQKQERTARFRAVPPPQPGPQGKGDPRQHYPRKPPPRPVAVDSEMGRSTKSLAR
jgi:hypothetical protein